jgi:hypothetical protein
MVGVRTTKYAMPRATWMRASNSAAFHFCISDLKSKVVGCYPTPAKQGEMSLSTVGTRVAMRGIGGS